MTTLIVYLSVALSIPEKVEDELGRLLGPTGLSGEMVLLGLSVTADATVVPPEGHSLLVADDVLEECDSLPVGKTLDGRSGFPGVLEVHTKVGAPSLGG